MLPILFKAGPITIYSFGFFLTLGYLAGAFILWREGKRQGYNEERLLDLSVISLIAALVGARAYFVLLHWYLFTEEPLSALAFWQGGFAYHGSLVAVLVAGTYFVRRWKWSFFQIADIGALSASVALVLGKIGTFLAGLDFGRQTSLPWGLNFPGLVGARHPVQLYEAGSYFIIFIFLYIIYHRNLTSTEMKSGKVFLVFLIVTSFVRVGLEFFKADPAMIFSIPIAVLASLIIAGFSIISLYYFQIRVLRDDLKRILTGFLSLNSRFLRKIGL